MKREEALSQKQPHEPREGDVYAVIDAYGKRFELRYGYYDERDRSGPPDVIYPDFLREPSFTEDGIPLATRMQDACAYYKGRVKRIDDATCGECEHFCRGEAWFGLCLASQNKREEQT